MRNREIDYRLHTIYKTSLALTGVTLFSFSLGMMQPTLSEAAATPQTQTGKVVAGSPDLTKDQVQFGKEISKAGSILKNDDNINLDLGIVVKGGRTNRIHAGDKFVVKLSADAVDISSFNFSWPHHSEDTFNNLFTVDKDPSNNTITITAKANEDFKGIQQLGIDLAGRVQTNSTQKLAATADASFVLSGQQKALNGAHYTFNVEKSASGSSSGSGSSTDLDPTSPNVDIVGDASDAGLSALHNSDDKASLYTDNWLNNGDPGANTLEYIYNQPSMLAFSQLALPSSKHPTSISWYLWPTDNNSKTLLTKNAAVWVHQNDGKSDNPKETYKMDGKLEPIPKTDPNYNERKGGLLFTAGSASIPKANTDAPNNSQPTINFVFYADAASSTQKVPLKTAVVLDGKQTLTASTTLTYQKSFPNGYAPSFKPRNWTIDLSKSNKPAIPSKAELEQHPSEIPTYFVQSTNKGDFDHKNGEGYSYKITGGNYNTSTPGKHIFQVTAFNHEGSKTAEDPDGNYTTRDVTLNVIGGATTSSGSGSSGSSGSTSSVSSSSSTTSPSGSSTSSSTTPSASSSSSSGTTAVPGGSTSFSSSSSTSSSVSESSSSTPTSTSSSTVVTTSATSQSSSDGPSEPFQQPVFPDYAAKKGMAVYSLRKIGIYNRKNFSTKAREAWYSRKPRVYRPMFVVTGYARSATGHLRYKVRDVNHLTKNRNKKGYITANWQYVRPVYYAKKHQKVTVINPRGVNAYHKVNLTGKVKNYKQGTVLNVAKAVHYHLTTRYILPNGKYITANRKLVKMGQHRFPKYVRARGAINRYQDVNLAKRNRHYTKRSYKLFKVYKFDYSHANSVSDLGALRYRVAHGYISGNTRLVKVIK